MVDVAHDRDDRRALDEIVVVIVVDDVLVLGVAERDDLDLLAQRLGDDLICSSPSVWVRVAISPMPMSVLMISGTGTPRYSARSLTVEPELTRTTSVRVSALASSGAAVSSMNVRRRRRRRRGGRIGGPPPGPGPPWPGPRRAAWESMTTRRLPAPGPPSPRWPPRVGRPPPGWDCVSSRLGRFGGSGTEMILGPAPRAGVSPTTGLASSGLAGDSAPHPSPRARRWPRRPPGPACPPGAGS